ncbi:MAG: ATP-dependent DNA helicase RecG [Paludibacteraceae bacterium]|nr:ATP-dependent DNA helicase RecG [Paludibacteraceae bacterium]MBO7337450.1 ATP-dependent DNA helicase RecG [Paludibacteraceae bacterium]MBP5136730.1 ATP-dependent DNA helicase RecG [Paludibacteraceae bacterium]MBP5742511.1 ATP-dependent DNA helicase RecG [Paludibacteraceae bacterium]
MDLSSNISNIYGFGPKRAGVLATEANIRSVEDLLYYFPFRYIDRSRFYSIREVTSDSSFIQIHGKIKNIKKEGVGKNTRLSCILYDETGEIELVWFKGLQYVMTQLSTVKEYIAFGKPTFFNGRFNIAHPELEEYTPKNVRQNLGWQAVYNTTTKMKKSYMTSVNIRKLIYTVLTSLDSPIKETLPQYITEPLGLMSLNQAIRNIHFPENLELLQKAQARLKFEELFYIQLSLLKQSKFNRNKFGGLLFNHIGDYFNGFYKNQLPFELTNAQKRVLKEIRADVGSGKQMNRLLQGDVGSGKTLVALLSMLMAADNGFQACFMAPTEILATQHYNNIKKMLGELGVNVALLTGSTKQSERKIIHEGLLDGSINFLIGTHALLEDIVRFSNLGLVIIDEQHRFGVAQRAKLWNKNANPPHVLVMTATPIPRTLAMTLYGDLDVSVIDELPPGRKPIKTYHYFEDKRDELLRFIKTQIDAGHQAYVVYPLIEESEKSDMIAAEQGYEYISTHLPQFKVSLVHGRLKPSEKDVEMRKFATNETQIMVATTVIEVGVDVPNASVMVIESANRFGLSQLHQLRGRVGRGAEQSFCILLTPYKISNETKKRIETMVATNDGFEIAEADLRLRGPGDIEGTAQSGLPFDLKIANLAKDGEILMLARDTAEKILNNDPTLSNKLNEILLIQLHKKSKNIIDWSKIS